MSDNYTTGYIQRRLTNNGQVIDISNIWVGFSDVRLVNISAGVPGVTDTFAAALWALDMSMTFASFGGYYINFFNSLVNNTQTILGAAPYFNPSPMYYGLLFSNLVIY
jgi:hypothetical protein